MEFDLDRKVFHPEATLLAESNDKWITKLAPHVEGGSDADFAARVDGITSELVAASVAPIAGATSLLEKLATTAIDVAMATNDSGASAQSQVDQLGWSEFITAVVGYDSGFGPKPEPGMLVGLIEHFGVAAADTLMVGDTWADAEAAAAAEVPFCLLDPEGGARRRVQADIVVASLDELDALLFGSR